MDIAVIPGVFVFISQQEVGFKPLTRIDSTYFSCQ
jgi:hypothetical protein